MRIGIDISVLQGGSAQRGMGRYTLQQLEAVINDLHEFFLFYQPFAPAPALTDTIIERTNVHLIPLDFPEAVAFTTGGFTREGERAYSEAIQRFLAPYRLDLFHLTCFDDNGHHYSPRTWDVCPLVMTVYDLIPLQMADMFLVDPVQRASYFDALEMAKHAAALIAISEYTRTEIIEQLGIDVGKIFVAPPFAASGFRARQALLPPPIVQEIGSRYLFAITGFGENKNLKHLLRAYASLPDQLRSEVKLVIVSTDATLSERPEFSQLVTDLNIGERLVWPPRLSDHEIISLYQHADSCVHISLVEGFGLPILEAMQCGTPVIASNRGAMLEVAGSAARLVNPEDVTAIAAALTEVLTAEDVRARMSTAGLERAKAFNVERVAEHTRGAYATIPPRRLRVAMWSPLPPARSGISDYTAELVPYLAEHIDLVIYTKPGVQPGLFAELPVVVRTYAELEEHRSEPIDVHIYHMGNNLQFHEEIYHQLLRQPGIVILHDLSLYGFYTSFIDYYGATTIKDEVAYSEGAEIAEALSEISRKWEASFESVDLLMLPLLRRTIKHSHAIITHSEFGRELVHRYDQNILAEFIHLGTFASKANEFSDQARTLRQRHGWTNKDIVFGIFGGINPIKRIHIVLDAFGSLVKTVSNIRLVIVGREDNAPYITDTLQTRLRNHKLQSVVSFVGEVSLDTLTEYIHAVDVAINLRWPTAGETSAVMMRALGAGKPLIITDLPQWSYFPENICWRIPLGPDEISTLVKVITEIASNKEHLKIVEQEVHNYIVRNATFEVVSQRYLDVIRSVADIATTPHRVSVDGINIIGDLHGDFGLSDIGRSMVSCLSNSGIPMAYQEMVFDISGRTTEFDEPPSGMSYNLNLFQMNAPQISQTIAALGKEKLYGRYNVGYWFYELPNLPAEWLTVIEELDEIWVATQFVKETVTQYSSKPVVVLPTPITVKFDPNITRRRFAIPEESFVFLFSFNTMASSARKNPFGLIAAFRQALQTITVPAILVIKVQFLNHFSTFRDEMLRRTKGLPILIIEENLSRNEMYNLINLCDCYVSLHRSEGLGLGMAEAMALGKPVIATGWSGNLDFMTDENSYLVKSTVGPIRDNQHEFQETHKRLYAPDLSSWADPDLNHAAALMRHVVENPAEAAEKGRLAAETIRHNYNATILGERIRTHLKSIDVTRGKYYDTPLPIVSTSRSTVRAATSGVAMAHLQRAFNDWNRERLRTTIRGFGTIINRIPGLGLLFRTIIRVRNLGKVWGAESVLLEALIREAENSALVQRNESSRLIGTLRSEVTALVDEKLVAMQQTVTSLNREITLLQQRNDHLESEKLQSDAMLDGVRRALEASQHLDALLNEQTRLNTSQLRLILFERSEAQPKAPQAYALEVVRWLESKYPELAKSSRIDFTIHGLMDDSQTISLGNHWQGRIANVRPDVWYHFDYTQHWQSIQLFENARVKLASAGVLVVAAAADEAVWTAREGFSLNAQHTFCSGEQRIQIAIYCKEDQKPN